MYLMQENGDKFMPPSNFTLEAFKPNSISCVHWRSRSGSGKKKKKKEKNQRVESAGVAFVKEANMKNSYLGKKIKKKNKPLDEQAQGRTNFWMTTASWQILCVLFV